MPRLAFFEPALSVPLRPRRWRLPVLSALFLLADLGAAALAQQVTQAQKDAIKSACRSDFMAQCSGVAPGGKEALDCLQQHVASLSSACQQAVNAIGGAQSTAPAKPPSSTSEMPPTGTGAAPAAGGQAMPAFSRRQEMMIAREACGVDFRTHCGTVPLGGGRGIACLRENMNHLSPGCRKVLNSGL